MPVVRLTAGDYLEWQRRASLWEVSHGGPSRISQKSVQIPYGKDSHPASLYFISPNLSLGSTCDFLGHLVFVGVA